MERPTRALLSAASSLSARRLAVPTTLAGRRRCLACQHQRSSLHTTSPVTATPLPHPTVPGPPPQPPQVAATQPEDRVARKKKQLELLQRGRDLKANPAKPTSVLQKRFWKDVSVNETPDGLQISLDARPVRTSSRQVLTLPPHKRALAAAIALEWDHLVSAQQALKQHYIPLTSLASRAVDMAAADAQGSGKARDDVLAMLLRYLDTDTLLCWAPETSVHDKSTEGVRGLRQRQRAVAEPIIAFLTSRVFPGVEIRPVLPSDSILPTPQPEVTREVIRGWICALPAFELAALERGVLATKSLLVAVRLLVEWSREFRHLQRDGSVGEKFGIDRAAEACSVEVDWQTSMWGEVEDTHDVEKADLQRQLGSLILLVS